MSLVEHVPATTRVAFADVEHGGTGRFDLVVHRPYGATVLVRPSLSRYQAETAATAINEALAEWIAAGALTIPDDQ